MLRLTSHTPPFQSTLRPHNTQPRESVVSMRLHLSFTLTRQPRRRLRAPCPHNPLDSSALFELRACIKNVRIDDQIPIDH
jgi:hypothetical protein